MASHSTSSSANGDSINSTASEAGNITVPKPSSSNAGDSCMWYVGGSCTQPRTGYDCLNVLLSTDECAINSLGACVSMSVYEEYLKNPGNEGLYFPADNYTYCSANDSVCSSCIEEWTSNNETTRMTASKTYCTGLDGCVCVEACEAPDWQQKLIYYECTTYPAGSSAGSVDASPSTMPMTFIMLACIIALIFPA